MKSVQLSTALMLYAILAFSQNNSSNISLLSNWNPDSISQYNDIWGYMDCQGGEYAILGSKTKIHFLDLEDNTNPVEVASFPGGQSTTWRDIKTFRNRAYAVSDNTSEGLMIFDLSNLPQTVTKTYHENTLFNNAHNIFIDEVQARMYVVGASAGHLLIFDLAADPDNPVLLVNTSLPGGYIHDLYVRDHIAYCSHLSSGMYVYDCSDTQNITTLGSVTDYLGTVFNHSSWLSEDGAHLVFCDETHGASVKILDVSDPTDMTVAPNHFFGSALESPDFTNSIAHNPLIRDNYVFISYYHDGVQVFDISNPDSIQRVAYFDTYAANSNYNGYLGCWGVYPFLSSGTIIASDINNGLFILSMDELNLEPTIDGIIPDATLAIDSGPILCEGDNVIMTALLEGDTYYIWTKDNEVLPVDGNILNISESGTYQLEVSNGMCTSFSEEHAFEFNESPDLSSMQGDEVEICAGDNYTIFAPTGLDYYLWMKNGNVLPNTNNVINVIESGVYTLLGYSNGCSSTSLPYDITVTNVPSPNLTISQENPCTNEIVMLEAAPGADIYKWYLNGNLFDTTDESFLTILDDGIYTVELITLNCSKLSEGITVSILPLPVNDISLSESAILCPGETVILGANESADVESWSWSLDGNTISTEPEIEVGESGLYQLAITGINGCVDYNQQYVDVTSPIIPVVTILGSTLISSEAISYQWLLSNQVIQGATQQSYSPLEAGSYTVETTNSIGCTAVSEPVQATMVAVETPPSLTQVNIYPNPVSKDFQIEVQSEVMSGLTIQLFHINGSLIHQQNLPAALSFSKTVHISGLPAGIYLLQLTNEEGSLVRKLVKE